MKPLSPSHNNKRITPSIAPSRAKGGCQPYWCFAIVVVASGLCGCIEQPKPAIIPTDDAPMATVIARVNSNAAAMDFLLKASAGTASGEFKRNDHKESFDLTATMLYRKPRDLYIKFEHLGGTIEAGSNSEEFWYWEKIDKPRYMWGRHEFMTEDIDADIPLRPDLLAEVLGISELPADTTGPGGPTFLVGSSAYELMYLKSDMNQQLRNDKAIHIDRFPPFLIRSIMYFREDGHPLMFARLSDYHLVKESGALAPHRISIDWLPDKGHLDLEFGNMERFDKPAAEKRFISPLQQGKDVGYIERVDHPSLPATEPSPPSEPPAE